MKKKKQRTVNAIIWMVIAFILIASTVCHQYNEEYSWIQFIATCIYDGGFAFICALLVDEKIINYHKRH